MLTAKRLRELFDYDRRTGIFTRRITTAGNAKVGTIAGCLANTGYLVIRADGKLYLAHRLAWLHVYGKWPKRGLDHRNMVRTENWIDNLREATSSQNKANKPKSVLNKSGYKGVCWDSRRGRWLAQIKKAGKTTFLGHFDDPVLAHKQYQRAAKNLFGEFARLS